MDFALIEIQELQSKINIALSKIKSLKMERKRQGEIRKDTKALQKRISKQIQNLKDDIGMWRAWHAFF